jgi:hypothetical protein
MALLLILIALFGFVFAGFGVGSSSSGSGSSSSTTTVAPTVTGYTHHPAVLKCSKHMGVKPSAQEQRRCGPPPANP